MWTEQMSLPDNSQAGRHATIIVPVYNTGKYKLTKCIKSITAQTYTDFLLVLVDDGSTDDSGRVCDMLVKNDSRIKVIHQVNKGSVDARKTGVFSDEAQAAKYICFCDSDDTMPKDALEKLITVAEKEQADCVCGQTRRIYRGITLPQRSIPPCFAIDEPKVYTNEEINSDLYISCFGISNYPVSLYAKLYRTELITQASNYDAVVKFMGEDLSVTLRLLPETHKLVIIPDIVYNYRIGGGTSKFMPYMLDDFLALYRMKKQMAIEHPMPQNAEYYMAIEMKNIVLTWLEMCMTQGRFSTEHMHEEIKRVCNLPEVQYAVGQKEYAERETGGMRRALEECDIQFIMNLVQNRIEKNRVRSMIKKLLR